MVWLNLQAIKKYCDRILVNESLDVSLTKIIRLDRIKINY
jgi:hypothetical protein